jgi:3-deoxy-D-manno-octulosonate 8-phosphate phosphatase (KDO 8-P phosphatase)
LIKLLVCDVDGTLTDGSIIYDDSGNELKRFCTRDGAGLFAAKAAGIKTMVLTGRESKATYRRMKELKVDYIFQNIKNKAEFLKAFCKQHSLIREDIGYIGDELNDLEAMKLCCFIACPKDSCEEVRQLASYVSPVNGGEGAVRDIIEHYLRDINKWTSSISHIYNISGF